MPSPRLPVPPSQLEPLHELLSRFGHVLLAGGVAMAQRGGGYGGGGNAGIAITSSFADGEMSTPYTDKIDVGPAGTPPFIMGAQHLPVGLMLNGETGEVTGTPQEAGRFFVIITL